MHDNRLNNGGWIWVAVVEILAEFREWFRKLGIYGRLLACITVVVGAYLIMIYPEFFATYTWIAFIALIICLHLVMSGRGHGSLDDILADATTDRVVARRKRELQCRRDADGNR